MADSSLGIIHSLNRLRTDETQLDRLEAEALRIDP